MDVGQVGEGSFGFSEKQATKSIISFCAVVPGFPLAIEEPDQDPFAMAEIPFQGKCLVVIKRLIGTMILEVEHLLKWMY